MKQYKVAATKLALIPGLVEVRKQGRPRGLRPLAACHARHAVFAPWGEVECVQWDESLQTSFLKATGCLVQTVSTRLGPSRPPDATPFFANAVLAAPPTWSADVLRRGRGCRGVWDARAAGFHAGQHAAGEAASLRG
jgi:hypothetical protein